MLDVDWSKVTCFLVMMNTVLSVTIFIHCSTRLYNVPKPFPLPLFDHRQYANMAREGLGYLVTSNDVR